MLGTFPGGFVDSFLGRNLFLYPCFMFVVFGTKKFARVFQFSLNTKNVQSFSFFWVVFWTSYSPRLQMQRFPDAKVVLTTHPKGAKGWAKSFLALMQVVRLQASDFSWTLSNSFGEKQEKGVSKNHDTPQIIHFNRVFHYKPSILGYPYFWEHPKGNNG